MQGSKDSTYFNPFLLILIQTLLSWKQWKKETRIFEDFVKKIAQILILFNLWIITVCRFFNLKGIQDKKDWTECHKTTDTYYFNINISIKELTIQRFDFWKRPTEAGLAKRTFKKSDAL